MARRPIALVAALVLLLEAVGIVALNAVMARFVEIQSMSLDGLDPDAMVTGTWALGIVSGLLLALCALVCLLAGVRDRRPGRPSRVLLIGCAVVHGVLGAVTVGLVGWAAFALMMVVLGLIVLTLVAYGETDADAGGPPPQPTTPPASGSAAA